MEEIIRQAANYRGGFVFRSDLLDIGLRDRHIREAMREGILERLRHGTYAPTQPTPRTPEQRHVLIARSILAKLGSEVALSHHSAALVHVGTQWGTDLSSVHVTRLDGRGSRTEAGVTFHSGRVVRDEDLASVDGMRVVVADRAVVESSSLASVEAGMVTTSFALRTGVCSLDSLHERLAVCERWPGMLHVRLAVKKAEPQCESVGEVRSLYLFGMYRVPRPEVQYVVRTDDGRRVARCDFGWEDHCHVGEFDGAVKYGRLNPLSGDAVGQVLVDEKRREDEIRQQQWGVSRWMWPDLDLRPRLTASRILSDLENSWRLYRRGRTTIA